MSKLKDLTEKAKVSIEVGRLCVLPATKRKGNELKQQEWLKQHEREIIAEILKLTNQTAFVFDSWSVGRYEVREKVFRDAVTIHWVDLLSPGRDVYSIFPIKPRVRARTVNGKKKGGALKGNKFTIGKKSNLYRFWLSTGLTTPGLTDFSRYMGNLKSVVCVGEFLRPKTPHKLSTESIKPLNVTSEQIVLSLRSQTPSTPHLAPVSSITRP